MVIDTTVYSDTQVKYGVYEIIRDAFRIESNYIQCCVCSRDGVWDFEILTDGAAERGEKLRWGLSNDILVRGNNKGLIK